MSSNFADSCLVSGLLAEHSPLTRENWVEVETKVVEQLCLILLVDNATAKKIFRNGINALLTRNHK